MEPFRLDTKLTKDGTLTLKGLPFHAGDAVEVIIVPQKAVSEQRSAYSLRGSVIQYERPTDPISQDDWEAL